MSPVWIAGRDKPHRCPQCWRCSNDGPIRSRLWSIPATEYEETQP